MPRDANEIYRQKLSEKLDTAVVTAMPLALAGDFDAAEWNGEACARYSLWFQGKSIAFPGRLQTNTGLPFLWKVYALADAAQPTLLAGSQSLYLIYLKEGTPVVEPLAVHGHDFASLQFLDAQNGQPDEEFNVYSVSEIVGMENLELLKGGNLLLVNRHLVFDIHTGNKWLFNKDNESIENYSVTFPDGALALSPNKRCIAFHGNFDSWNTATEDLPDSEHAIIVFDFEKDDSYVVKYDDTETRMTKMEEIDIAWFNTYFEWTTLASGDSKLQLRKLDRPIHWHGKIRDDDYYCLYPVKPSMHPVFLDFVFREMGWTKANILEDKYHEYTGRRITLGDDHTKLDLVFKKDAQELTLSKHLYLTTDANDPVYPALIKKIADAFNSELDSGQHQEHFGRIISETKAIRSL